MPSLLDPSLAPDGRHIVHAFTPDWIDAWQDLSPDEYERKKEEVADAICKRLDAVFPGLSDGITFREVRVQGVTQGEVQGYFTVWIKALLWY